MDSTREHATRFRNFRSPTKQNKGGRERGSEKYGNFAAFATRNSNNNKAGAHRLHASVSAYTGWDSRGGKGENELRQASQTSRKPNRRKRPGIKKKYTPPLSRSCHASGRTGLHFTLPPLPNGTEDTLLSRAGQGRPCRGLGSRLPFSRISHGTGTQSP